MIIRESFSQSCQQTYSYQQRSFAVAGRRALVLMVVVLKSLLLFGYDPACTRSLRTVVLALRGGRSSESFYSIARQMTSSTNQQSTHKKKHRVHLAVGSNLGDRFGNIQGALRLLTEGSETRLLCTSFLHQTAPMYLSDQPTFWNGAVALETDLEPTDLLRRIKTIEQSLGRDLNGVRNGPRPVDLDIIFVETRSRSGDEGWTHLVLDEKDEPDLIVPHPRMQERDFVLLPLLEIAGRDFCHPVLNATLGTIMDNLVSNDADSTAVRVLPLPRGRAICFNKTICMGILNVTPDSFSDGGQWSSSLDQSIERALEMEKERAGIIDIGGESTRPGADEVYEEEEIARTVPVIQGIRKGEYTALAKLFPSAMENLTNESFLRCSKCPIYPFRLIRDMHRLQGLPSLRVLIS